MKILLTLFVLLFSSSVFADDISDFQIEGMSIGDSLLDYFTKKEIQENLEKIFNDDLGSSYFPQLAEEYIKEGDYELAKKVCNVGLILNPNNNDGKFLLAKVEMINGSGKVAEGLLKEILSEDSLYINAMRLLVMHYNSKSIKQVEMIKMVHQILDLLPNDEFASEILKSSKKTIKKQSSKKTIKKQASKKTKKVTSKPKTKKISKPTSEPENHKIDINPKMATLTFVDILIKPVSYTHLTLPTNREV